MPRPIAVQISIPAMRHNLSQVYANLRQQVAPLQRSTPSVWAVIKANAYGHGVAQAVQGFATADCSVDTDTVIAALESGESFTSSRGEYSFSAEDRIAVTADVLTARTFQWNDGDIQFVSAD